MSNKSIKEESYFKNFQRFLNEADDKQLAANLMAAYKAGPAATRAYLDSEEGSSEELRALLLKPQPESDGASSDDVVKVGTASGPAMGFMPTQNEIDLMKSVSFPLGSVQTLVNAITTGPIAKGIVTSGNLIIDGHHRWSGAIGIGGENAQIQGQSVEWPGQNTAEMLAAAQIAIAAKLGPGKSIPSQSEGFDTNILGKGAAGIATMILKNVNKKTDPGAPGALLNDEMMKQLANSPKYTGTKIVLDWLGMKAVTGKGKTPDSVAPDEIYFGTNYDDESAEGQRTIDQLRRAIAEKVGQNLASLPANSEAPERKDMPQFDTKVGGPPLKTITGDLSGGKFNVSPPFAKESKIQKRLDNYLKESITKSK